MTAPVAGLSIPADAALDFVSLGALVHRLDSGVIPFRKARECQIHVSGGQNVVAPVPLPGQNREHKFLRFLRRGKANRARVVAAAAVQNRSPAVGHDHFAAPDLAAFAEIAAGADARPVRPGENIHAVRRRLLRKQEKKAAKAHKPERSGELK